MLRLLRPMCPRAHTLQQGRPLRWEASALQLEISPHLPQQRKAVIATKTQWSQKYINNIKNRWTDRDMCTHTHTHTHTHRNTLSHKKEWNFGICSNMDGVGGHYAKWNKSDREKQILYDITFGIEKRYDKQEYNKREADLQIQKIN